MCHVDTSFICPIPAIIVYLRGETLLSIIKGCSIARIHMGIMVNKAGGLGAKDHIIIRLLETKFGIGANTNPFAATNFYFIDWWRFRVPQSDIGISASTVSIANDIAKISTVALWTILSIFASCALRTFSKKKVQCVMETSELGKQSLPLSPKHRSAAAYGEG